MHEGPAVGVVGRRAKGISALVVAFGGQGELVGDLFAFGFNGDRPCCVGWSKDSHAMHALLKGDLHRVVGPGYVPHRGCADLLGEADADEYEADEAGCAEDPQEALGLHACH